MWKQVVAATCFTTKFSRRRGFLMRIECAQQRQTATFCLPSADRTKEAVDRRGGAMIAAVSVDPNRGLHRTLSISPAASEYKHRVYIAVGSNLGDRYANIRRALQLLSDHVRLVRTSFLHETAPMYVTDQPAFLNGAVVVETDLEPLAFLRRIKDIEGKLGRDFASGARNGPRPVDLDILLYETIGDDPSENEALVLNTPELTVPHPRIQERDFVMIPLIEVAGSSLNLPGRIGTVGEALARLREKQGVTENEARRPSAVRVLPLPRGRMLYFNETIIMGILNATPDSFSDGGKWTASVDCAVQMALAMEQEGAGIIDIGGESTRPGALEVSIEVELQRTIPIIEGIRKGTFDVTILVG
jgi:2-amino-4-hydroxy-6-hydroxymethyldihydropteridine diphosphokinase